MTEQTSSGANRARRRFLKIGVGIAAGAALASVMEVSVLGDRNYAKDQQIVALGTQLQQVKEELSQNAPVKTRVQQLTSQTEQLQSQVDQSSGFVYLNQSEQSLLEAIAETVIPSDSNGPGAKEAGVVYFIDRQLGSDYGSNGRMYMQGPFVQAGLQDPIVVDNITYPRGSTEAGLSSGMRYQYHINLRYFWRAGLDALAAYSSSAYGGQFQGLPSSEMTKVLVDLWNDVPPSFNGILPSEFAYELFFMIWSGFLTDPIYGGNRGMVGWEHVGFNGTNQGNFYGEGHSPEYLMTSTAPVRLKPASLAQFQKVSQLL